MITVYISQAKPIVRKLSNRKERTRHAFPLALGAPRTKGHLATHPSHPYFGWFGGLGSLWVIFQIEHIKR